MSRSKPTGVTNPAEKFFEWSGSMGALTHYNKEKGEKEKVPFPFTFLVLDQLSTVVGYSDEIGSGIWSNEVRNTKIQPLTVKTKNGVLAKGLYEEVKNIKGAKFAKSIYIAYYDEERNLKLGNIKASGACLSAWIEFSKGKNLMVGAVTLAGAVSAKKGSTKYFVPVFEAKSEVSEATEERAAELDRVLQKYLASYLADAPVADEVEEEVFEEIETKSSPFEDDHIPF